MRVSDLVERSLAVGFTPFADVHFDDDAYDLPLDVFQAIESWRELQQMCIQRFYIHITVYQRGVHLPITKIGHKYERWASNPVGC